MKYLLLTFLLTLAVTTYSQQKLVFTNTHTGKIVVVKEFDFLKVSYRGYLGQIQTIYGKVNLITDSLIRFDNNWSVRVNDIIGFRKFGKYRELFKSVTEVVTLTAVIIAVPLILFNNPGLDIWQRLGITAGISVGAAVLGDLLFPDGIKNFMAGGWVAKVERME